MKKEIRYILNEFVEGAYFGVQRFGASVLECPYCYNYTHSDNGTDIEHDEDCPVSSAKKELKEEEES